MNVIEGDARAADPRIQERCGDIAIATVNITTTARAAPEITTGHRIDARNATGMTHYRQVEVGLLVDLLRTVKREADLGHHLPTDITLREQQSGGTSEAGDKVALLVRNELESSVGKSSDTKRSRGGSGSEKGTNVDGRLSARRYLPLLHKGMQNIPAKPQKVSYLLNSKGRPNNRSLSA